MQLSPRERRLAADARAISQLLGDSSILQADGKGNPPTQYRLKFLGTGLALNAQGRVAKQEFHEVHVDLGAAYPRLMPTLTWKTPVFHPNISAGGVVCLGGYGTHWVPSLSLAELCCMLWDMIRFHNYDINSPYNRDAAAWIRDQKELALPLDPRPLRNLVTSHTPGPAGASARSGSHHHEEAQAGVLFIGPGPGR